MRAAVGIGGLHQLAQRDGGFVFGNEHGGMVDYRLDQFLAVRQLPFAGIDLRERQLGHRDVRSSSGIDHSFEMLLSLGEVPAVGGIGSQEEFRDGAFICSRILGRQFAERLLDRFIALGGGRETDREFGRRRPDRGILNFHGRVQRFLADAVLMATVQNNRDDNDEHARAMLPQRMICWRCS